MKRLLWLVLASSLVIVGCGDDDDPASSDTGTMKIVVQEMAGVEDYRLLAGVWDGSLDLVGGAFWMIVDSDPWSGEDLVHPPYHGEGEYEGGRGDGWGAGDYEWDRTAQLDLGTYRVEFWASHGELPPYGSHFPSGSQLRCVVDVEVAAGETTTLAISGVPPGGEICPDASWSST